MKKSLISVLLVGVLMFTFALNANKVYAATVDSDWEDLYDWSDYLDEYEERANAVYVGPLYHIGIIGKRDIVEMGDEVSIEFRLVHDYLGSFKPVSQLLEMQHQSYNSLSITSQVSVSVSTTIGQTSVARLGLTDGNIGNASVEQGNNISTTLSVGYTYTEQAISSDTFTYNFNLSVIPAGESLVGYGKVAVYVKYKVNHSFRREYFWWGEYTEGGTQRSDYYAYKYLFSIDSFIYTNNTFGDTEFGIYPYQTIHLGD